MLAKEEAILDALSFGSASSIAREISADPLSVRLNLERGAVQLLGCNGGLASHIPLGPEFLIRVARELRELGIDLRAVFPLTE